MTSKQLIKEINSYCLKNAQPDNVIKYSRYFKDGLYNGYGLTAPQIYAGLKEMMQLKGISLSLVMETAPDIITHSKYDEISIALLLVKEFHKQFSKATFEDIGSWYNLGINNWAHADTMGMMILPLFLKKDIIHVHDFSSWLTAQNKFKRRCVPVTLIKLLKSHGNFSELFNFIECLMTDPEREVHQGAGWFLREAWKRKPDETEDFLMKWKDVSPRLIIQYATEKMTKEGKMKFRKLKKFDKV